MSLGQRAPSGSLIVGAMTLLILTLLLGQAARWGWITDKSGLYSIAVGISGALWGLLLGLFLTEATGTGGLPFLARLAAIPLVCLFLYGIYWASVPDYIVTDWGPLQDRIASWAIAGLTALPGFVCAVAFSLLLRLLRH